MNAPNGAACGCEWDDSGVHDQTTYNAKAQAVGNYDVGQACGEEADKIHDP